MGEQRHKVDDQAFVTLVTNDVYSLGALVLGHSLRKVNTTRKLVVMVTPGVSEDMKLQLRNVYDVVEHVDVLDSNDMTNLALLSRIDLGITFTKLHCWRLTNFNKCVFLDADTLVIQNVDDLFEREELSAAPDAGWPDCFNSGVFVYRPSIDTYKSLLQFAVDYGSFDGGDQGLLNLFFKDWATKDISRHLPFVYNVVSQAFYSYLPAFKQYGHNIKIVHFIGETKPWHYILNTATGKVEGTSMTLHNQRFLQLWWSLFLERVQPHVSPDMPPVQETPQARLVNVSERYPPPLPPLRSTYAPAVAAAKWRAAHRPVSPPVEHEGERHMTSPYSPPDVVTFYELGPPPSTQPACGGGGGDAIENVVVENKDDRPYTFFESFYPEAPMTHTEMYPTPLEMVYSAKEFAQTWSTYNEPPPPEPEILVNIVVEERPTVTDVNHNELGGKQAALPRVDVVEVVITDDDKHGTEVFPLAAHGGGDMVLVNGDKTDIADDDGGDAESDSSETPSPDDYDDTVGIIGGLANIRLNRAGYSDTQLDDRSRQYAWERGQIDYCGIDSFDNIRRQLDKVLSEPELKPSTSAIPSKD